MKEFEKLIDVIKKHEGFSSHAYEDSLGYLTIGYGRCVDKKIRTKGLTVKEAEFLLFNDIMEREELAKQFNFFNDLDKVRKEVIIEMIFNIGYNGFKGFVNTIKLIEKKKYVEASKELLNSEWARKVKEIRANNVAYRLAYGAYP